MRTSKGMHELLLSILLLWFPDKRYKDFWFSSAFDDKIRKQYHALHDEHKTKSVQQLLEIVNAADAHERDNVILAITICLDQFTRNIYREEGKLDRNVFAPTDNLCYGFLSALNLFDLQEAKRFPIHQRIFILLPFRHQRRTDLQDKVLLHICNMEQEASDVTEQSKKNEEFSLSYNKRRKIYNLISIYSNNKNFIFLYHIFFHFFGKYKNSSLF